jgi:hypothetical protein
LNEFESTPWTNTQSEVDFETSMGRVKTVLTFLEVEKVFFFTLTERGVDILRDPNVVTAYINVLKGIFKVNLPGLLCEK